MAEEPGFFDRLFKRIKEAYNNFKYEKIAKRYKIDPCIVYPSYKSMDQFIDTEQLASLDKYIADYILAYMKNKNLKKNHFFVGKTTMKFWKPHYTQSYYLPLNIQKGKYNYWDSNNPEKYQMTQYGYDLPKLMDFIKTLPFKKTARIILMFDMGGHIIEPHRDHIALNVCHEFIWFRTNFKKKFYVYANGEKKYVEGYSAWFDTVNQYHGADPTNELNFSIRVDGIFDDKLRALIPIPPFNLASTPAYWVCRE